MRNLLPLFIALKKEEFVIPNHKFAARYVVPKIEFTYVNCLKEKLFVGSKRKYCAPKTYLCSFQIVLCPQIKALKNKVLHAIKVES